MKVLRVISCVLLLFSSHSHDRVFLDNVVTSILTFEEKNGVQEYVGGYSDWVRRGIALTENDMPQQLKSSAKNSDAQSDVQKNKVKKLSYKLQRELDELPDKIENLENDIDYLQGQIAQPEFYDREYEETRDVLETLTKKQAELDAAMVRWSELEQ